VVTEGLQSVLDTYIAIADSDSRRSYLKATCRTLQRNIHHVVHLGIVYKGFEVDFRTFRRFGGDRALRPRRDGRGQGAGTVEREVVRQSAERPVLVLLRRDMRHTDSELEWR
jgi:hypothetical protein